MVTRRDRKLEVGLTARDLTPLDFMDPRALQW